MGGGGGGDNVDLLKYLLHINYVQRKVPFTSYTVRSSHVLSICVECMYKRFGRDCIAASDNITCS